MSDKPREGEGETAHQAPHVSPYTEAVSDVTLPPSKPPEASPEPSVTAAPLSADRKLAIGLACALVAVVLLAATAPFWASALPWGTAHDDAALSQRVDRLENAERQSTGLQQRLDRLDATQQDTQNAQQRVAAIETAQQQLDKKLDQVTQQQAAGLGNALQPLDRRVAALEAKPAVAPSDLAALRQQVDKSAAATGDLAARIETLDKAARARATDATTDLALTLALLRIREAIDTGRPFVAEYGILSGVARDRSDIAPAVTALAEPAKTGVATRAVLIARLKTVGDDIASAPAPRGDGGWKAAIADKLSGLVQIHRVDDTGSLTATNAADASIVGAERALAGSDLESAVASVAALSGPAAGRAAPWLRMAQARLAVETSLRKIEESLVARLGKASPQPTSSGSPG